MWGKIRVFVEKSEGAKSAIFPAKKPVFCGSSVKKQVAPRGCLFSRFVRLFFCAGFRKLKKTSSLRDSPRFPSMPEQGGGATFGATFAF